MRKKIDVVDTPRRQYEKVSAENIALKDKLQDCQEEIKALNSALKRAKEAKAKQKEEYEAKLAELAAIIEKLKNELAHEKALNSNDGTNAGIPTSQTPPGKKKVVPNTRRSTGKSRGGQKGHPKSGLAQFADSEVTETAEHTIDTDTRHCKSCGEKLVDTGKVITKDEFDIKIVTVKRRHRYHVYKCVGCGREFHAPIENALKETNQYGSATKGTVLSLMASGNMPTNKIGMFLHGATGNQMKMSDGYICKTIKRAANTLMTFMADLKKVIIQRTLLYWDDTVIFINKARACMRFYGDETISYYTAHMKKDLNSLVEDGILTVLTDKTRVMHDHNTVNYNPMFFFLNLECNQHLQRDLQRSADDNPGHTWAKDLKELISTTIEERKKTTQAGEEKFAEGYSGDFHRKVNGLLEKGLKEEAVSTNKGSVTSEGTLIRRIEKYYDNYFMWIDDFSLPTTNNLSERGLRSIKSKMKISGQFYSEETASYFAIVKTYVETCRKNGINEAGALLRLCAGNPYTADEIFTPISA